MYTVDKFLLQIICLCVTAKYCHGAIYVNSSYIRVSRQINGNGCVLPKHPIYGHWKIYQPPLQLSPGQLAPSGTIVQVSCKENYKLDGDAALVCINGNWTTKIGQCLRTCPAIQNTAFMTVTCTHNNRKLESCNDVVDGTIARFQCADFYEDQGLERHPVHICSNGKWSHTLPECVPICGQKSIKEDPTLIVGGLNVTKGDYPWQVALYNISNKNLICGGSLINQRVVLTAAHCITENEDGKLLSKEFFMVAVGKYFRQYEDDRDFNEAQFSSIYEMYVPKQYKGDTQNFFGDIALLVTKKTFVLSVRVQPVCVDWGFAYHHALLDPTRTIHGYVSGWGYTVQHKNPSDVLKQLKVPLITEEQCTKRLPEDYTRYVTDDKLCAGYLESGTAVCKGDSGGGLVTKHKNRYYIVAVVSLSPQAPTAEGGCDSQQYGLYTRVSYYTETFILEKEARFRPSALENVDCEDDPNCKAVVETISTTTITKPNPVAETPKGNCILPEHPHFGQWSLFGASFLSSPGTSVSPGTILQVSCNTGYKLNGIANILCENGKWAAEIGQCLLPCPPIKSTETIEITCSFRDKETKDCSNPLDGTIAKHKCAPFYEDLQLAKNPVRICRNGSWDLAIPECIPICGLKSVTAQPLIINGVTAKKGEYPWQVAIYRGARKQFICGGALISQKAIVTAAHCVSTPEGKLQSKEMYYVAVGKLYQGYYDPLDSDAQFSELQDMFIPLEYAGSNNNYLANIAVLVTKQPFVLSQRVQPVCVDWGHKYSDKKNTSNSSSYVSGWGFTTPTSNPSDTLQYLEVPVISNADCSKALPEGFVTFLKYDTFCAGYLNKSTSVCKGDSGGALVTKHEGRYYITGIVRVAPVSPDGGCDSQQYTLYTRVSDYTNFISEKEAQIKSSTSSDSDCRNNCPTTTTPKPTTAPEVIKTTCTLPQHPDFGNWALYGGLPPGKFSPGGSVEIGTVLKINCYNSYKLEGDYVILCEKGQWSSPVGKCLKKCPSVYSSPNLKATCITKGKESENCTEPTDGTRVKYECAPYYEDQQLSQNPIHVCQNGTWDRKKPQCVPVCGQKSVTPQILIVNGNTAKKGDYPWNVAIYRESRKEFVCSGSLISPRVILTGAVCVTNSNGQLNSKDLYTVAVGKYYRKFDDSREKTSDVQFPTLQEIFVPSQYKGASRNFISNIAVLVTTKPLTLSQRVQPVCVDWGLKYAGELLKPNNNLTGYVPGWGYTSETENPADELQELQIPIITNQKCQQEIPEDFSVYFTYDKFCAGHRNAGKAVCKGDSGGGLVVKFNGRYYITGIVDIAPSNGLGGCDSQQYALYTKVSEFIDNFILEKAIQYK